MQELSAALFSMDMFSNPGPDGFGPSFYKAFWLNLKNFLLDGLADCHEGRLDLDGLNRAHLVLLPKGEGVRKADGFWPIFPPKLPHEDLFQNPRELPETLHSGAG
jgi:hypothetical protein